MFRRELRWGACVVGLSLVAVPAAAQSLRATRVLDAPNVGSSAQHTLEIDGLARLSQNETLDLVLPDGVFQARRVRRRAQEGGFYWEGVIHEGWPALLTYRNGGLSGLIDTPWARYEIFAADCSGESCRGQLSTLDDDLFPACETAAAGGGTAAPSPAASSSFDGEPKAIMDALIVYTPQARAGAGGVNEIETVIRSAVNVMNTSFENSQINAELHLMAIEEAPFSESGNLGEDLGRLRGSAAVATLRDRFGADLVALITNGGGCGVGYVQRRPGVGFASSAFQVTARGCAVGNITLAHEFGHNLGCEHDPANGGTPAQASFPYAFGHFHSGSYRTVMSYASECTGGCPRAPFFSNAAISHRGESTGIADQRENARVINQTAPIATRFRPSASLAAFAQSEWRVREDQGGVEVVIERTGAIDWPASILVRSRGDSAEVDVDFPAFTATVSWGAGEDDARTLFVPIRDDMAQEGDERFDLVLEEGRGVGPGMLGTVPIVIEDHEEGVARAALPVPILENAGEVAVSVDRVEGSDGPVSVAWALVGGTATPGRDFTQSSGTLVWEDARDDAQSIVIELLDDVDVEGDETFVLELSNPSGGLRVPNPQLAITLVDYEEGAFSFSVTSTAVREDDQELRLSVAREGGTDGSAWFEVVARPVSGAAAATPGQDFSIPTATVAVAPGVTTAQLTVSLTDDIESEGEEAFLLRIAKAGPAARVGPRHEVRVSIQDWEQGQLDVVQPVVRIDEDEASVAVEVARAEGQDGPASVRYRTRAGTAGDGEDFQGVAGLLTWDDGEAGTRRIEIPLFGDRLEEGDETLTVELTDYAGARAGAQRAAEITLLDDIYLRPAEGRIASGGCTCLQPPPDRGPGSAWAPLAWLVAGFGLVRARRRPRAEASGSRS